MIWAVLVLLGVPLWLVLGAIGGTLWSRHRFRSQEGVFPLAMRAPGELKWPRLPAYGRVISDVFIVNRGLALQRTLIRRVVGVDAFPVPTPSPKRVANAAGRLLELDDGAKLEVALNPNDATQFDSLEPLRLRHALGGSDPTDQPVDG